MNGFVLGYFLVELIRVFHRAVFYTGAATRAFVLYDISGLLCQGCPIVTLFALNGANFG